MGMSWEGPNSRSMGYGVFANAQMYILLGALRTKEDNSHAKSLGFLEDFESIQVGDFNELPMGKMLLMLAEDDPIRGFLKQNGKGKLSPKESAALAARLAEVIYFLTVKRQEHENFIFLPHLTKTRQFQDSQLNQIALFMWEFASAAEKGIAISWE